jgi:hypothetical protein
VGLLQELPAGTISRGLCYPSLCYIYLNVLCYKKYLCKVVHTHTRSPLPAW